MTIYRGSTKIGAINVGGSNIKEVYKGSTKVMIAVPATPDGFIFRELSDDGVLSLPTGELPIFDWVTEIGDLQGYCGFRDCTGLTGEVSFPNLVSINTQGLMQCFYGCTGLTGGVSFPSLTTIGSYGLYSCFAGCFGLTGIISFPKLTSIGTNGLRYIFPKNITEVHFPKALEGNSECTASNMGCAATVYFDL